MKMKTTVVMREVVILNRLGLHARAAAQFVKTAGRFRAEITVGLGGQQVNGKSIMGLLMLTAAQGTVLTLRAVGEDGTEALDALAELVRSRFGERE
jgi:phosphocarrier protein